MEDDEDMLAYAQVIGADSGDYRQALSEVPFMTEERFRQAADALFLIANSLSEKAYHQTLLLQEKKERDEREKMRRTLMDRSRDGIAIIGQDHRVMECNRRFAEMLGYEPQDALGLFTWQYEAIIGESEIREIFSDLSVVEAVFETMHRRRDGTIFDVEVSVAGASLDGTACVITICRDISERKEAERQIRQSEAHFRALFELSQDGIVLTDSLGRFLDANSAYCRRTGDTSVYQKEYRHKDGHVFPVEIRHFAVCDEEGRVRFAWGIVRNISERMRTERASARFCRLWSKVLPVSS